jgi:hypothetical protein
MQGTGPKTAGEITAPVVPHSAFIACSIAARCLKQLKQLSVGAAVWLKHSTGTVPASRTIRGLAPIGDGNQKSWGSTMPRSELAATALALIVGTCLALPSLAGAEQSSSRSVSKPVDTKQLETHKTHTAIAKASQKAEERDRLMQWLNESALLTGTDEQAKARSIRFR